jgi:hypothetical protein
VKRRNFVPVSVLKHCSRKFSVSSTSMPDGGSGRESVEERAVDGWRGLRRVVIAWTLSGRVSHYKGDIYAVGRKGEVVSEDVPMERPSEHEVVIDRELIQTLCEVTLIYQPTRLINDDQCVDDPVARCQYGCTNGKWCVDTSQRFTVLL